MANEAGAGAVDRGTNLQGYTVFSPVVASASDDCQRFAVYLEGTGGTIKFGFASWNGSIMTLETAAIEVTAAAGSGVQEFTAGVDFTAFAVTAGWYLACYTPTGVYQTVALSGGTGLYYKGEDFFLSGSTAPSSDPDGLDGMEADIGGGGAAQSPVPIILQLGS